MTGEASTTFGRKELAKIIAYVPQYHTPPFPYTVQEVVLMGRGVHISETGAPKARDIEKAEEVMEEPEFCGSKNMFIQG
ncbi:MAG: ABC transporter ATP-binding protein [Muricomes sp.]